MGREPSIEYIDMPETLKDKYQYFTEARMDRLSGCGCPVKFRTLEDAVKDYVVNYLQKENKCL
jgi:ADP-L-glycero-D-manno-heptose 6-epimerase